MFQQTYSIIHTKPSFKIGICLLQMEVPLFYGFFIVLHELMALQKPNFSDTFQIRATYAHIYSCEIVLLDLCRVRKYTNVRGFLPASFH